MPHRRPLVSFRTAFLLAILAGGAVFSGCSTTDSATKLTRELLGMPKEEAYAKGDALLARRKYDLGRQYLRFVAENYANDPLGRQAALRLADSFFDEKTLIGYVEAQARYKDFRNRYPSHPKADYALYRLALCSDRQAEKPDRDQTNTRLAATSYRDVLTTYPDSPYTIEARARYNAMRDLLAEHEYRVAHFYFKRGAYVAAKGRYDVIFSSFPDFKTFDRVLFEAGWTESRLGHTDDAHTLWERLSKEYPASPLVKKLPAHAAPSAEPASTNASASGAP